MTIRRLADELNKSFIKAHNLGIEIQVIVNRKNYNWPSLDVRLIQELKVPEK